MEGGPLGGVREQRAQPGALPVAQALGGPAEPGDALGQMSEDLALDLPADIGEGRPLVA